MSKNLQNIEDGKVILYKKGIEVQLREDTVWLSLAQMCELFDKNKKTTSEHIRNIFKEKELFEN